MPSLKEKAWKRVYRTGEDNLLSDFYLKAMSIAARYDRAVGYFSSELLILASQGISNLIKAKGKMRLVIGHPLDEEEYQAVKKRADLSWVYKDLEVKIFSVLDGCEGEIAKNRLQLLTWLLACGTLEIKFAFRRKGMYHEKIGIITDATGDRLIFQGSANETFSAMDIDSNAESISVYPSWDEDIYKAYGEPFERGFETLWSGHQNDTFTVALPSSIYESISKSASEKGCPDLDLETSLIKQKYLDDRSLISGNTYAPYIPEVLFGKKFDIRGHQKRALTKWKANDYLGILKLATGSGKTITAIYGSVKIYEAFKKLFVVVAVPYNELAGQWVDNLGLFGIFPHKCYDSKDLWFDRFKLDVQAFLTGKKKFVFAVVINKTMMSDGFQDFIKLVPNEYLLFIGDECHRHGAENTAKFLPDAGLRMGLSATPYRDDDDEIDSPFPDKGRERLTNYYGSIVDEYSLSDAINDDVLTPYMYHICVVNLTDEEQELYEELSLKIGNIIRQQSAERSKGSGDDPLTLLCAQRSRLLGSAEDKLFVLKDLISKLDEDEKKHALFYCAEGSSERSGELTKNVDQVSTILNDNQWRVAQFTSLENSKERKSILSSFLSGGVDALVSMKVLDEGVDIPVCKTAFILASTKNPRQYIQRRGRILRKFEGKSHATIYDFVVLPAKGWEGSAASKNLIKSEMERIDDFMALARNRRDVYKELEKHEIAI